MFWLCAERETYQNRKIKIENWPSVIAIIPSRNEEDTLPITLPSLLEQDYPGIFSVIVVDDQSEDKTEVIARKISEKSKKSVYVVEGINTPTTEWTGKIWALAQGVQTINQIKLPCEYFLFTDADIIYQPHSLKMLILEAKFRKTLLTSFMVRLNCETTAEKFLIPAFVFFFQMIFPFAWVNQKHTKTAAAAGGCILIDKEVFERSGGVESFKSTLIDDCALAKKIKKYGPIWLGLAHSIRSIRVYPRLEDIRKMVSRTAYAQLNNSPFLLVATVVGMFVTFLIPPILTVHASFPMNIFGVIVWIAMIVCFIPTLRYYKASLSISVFLPLIATTYIFFTLDSAYRYYCGKGGLWKGRLQAK